VELQTKLWRWADGGTIYRFYDGSEVFEDAATIGPVVKQMREANLLNTPFLPPADETPRMQGPQSQTPLSWCMILSSMYWDRCKVILGMLFDVSGKPDASAQDANGCTALHHAVWTSIEHGQGKEGVERGCLAERGCLRAVKYLLEVSTWAVEVTPRTLNLYHEP
jgi:hypothetical protein